LRFSHWHNRGQRQGENWISRASSRR
jgi:hypothetical protein